LYHCHGKGGVGATHRRGRAGVCRADVVGGEMVTGLGHHCGEFDDNL
jgi:hypothetical protein